MSKSSKQIINNYNSIFNRDDVFEELEKAYSLLQKSYDEIDKFKIMKVEFIAFMTHILKTPLTNLSAFHLLDRSKLTDEQKDVYDIVSHGYTEMKYIIDRAIEYFSIFTKPPDIKPEIVAFMTLIGNTIYLSLDKFKANDISYVINIKQNVFFETDLDIIYKIINIITDNALKFNKQNGKVIYTCLDADEKVKITVEDTGYGIKIIPINEIFSLLNIQGLKFHAHGAGLSLPIAKNLTHYINGELYAENRKTEGGACFTIELPKTYVKKTI
jgi:signal transduction histidine kinase